jgi:hypothetical protein
MTAHELARRLLAGPDVTVVLFERGGCSECDPEGCGAFAYHEVDSLETTVGRPLYAPAGEQPRQLVVL